MQVSKTKLDGVLEIIPDIFEDHRGYYVETYNKKDFHEHGIEVEFLQDDLSVSRKDVLRGLHGDGKTWKLVSCPMGTFYLVVVNCVKDSPQFGQWESFICSESNRRQILIPPHFANGHLILSERATFAYKQSAYYESRGQFSYKWNDPQFKVWWPIQNPILSRRDEAGAYVEGKK